MEILQQVRLANGSPWASSQIQLPERSNETPLQEQKASDAPPPNWSLHRGWRIFSSRIHVL